MKSDGSSHLHVGIQPRWQRIILLTILGYEGAGAILGGILLIAGPDGRYMDMPVELLRGAFPDFLIPGIILLGLGILSTWAFVIVLRKRRTDWLLANLALGGFFIWFVVEIMIINELHWLHLMWGVPVLLGWIMAIALLAIRQDSASMRKTLLMFGMLSSLWYLAINVFVPSLDPSYDVASLTVSELSAIGAPTRITWVLLVSLYPMLFATFGWGLVNSARDNWLLRTTGMVIILNCIFNLYWPPMHLREVIGAGGGTLTDTLHITWAMVTLLLMMLIMGFGAAALNWPFRWFSIGIFIIFLVFGVLIGTESSGIEANLPTPHIGIWERINIGAFMLWVIMFSIMAWFREKRNGVNVP
jgi:hypothetical protein